MKDAAVFADARVTTAVTISRHKQKVAAAIVVVTSCVSKCIFPCSVGVERQHASGALSRSSSSEQIGISLVMFSVVRSLIAPWVPPEVASPQSNLRFASLGLGVRKKRHSPRSNNPKSVASLLIRVQGVLRQREVAAAGGT